MIAEPEVHEYEITPQDRYLVIASDGLFDVISNEALGKMLLKTTKSAAKIAQDLVAEAYKKDRSDDITVIVLKLLR